MRRRLVSVFWEAGRDKVFLVSEPRFSTCDVKSLTFDIRKRDLVLTENLKTSYSYTAIYIYYPLWYWLHLEL